VKKKAAALLSVFLICLPVFGIVIKEEIGDYREYLDRTKKELGEIKKKISAERKEISKEKYREKVTTKYIHKLNRELDITRKEMEVFDNNLEVLVEGITGLNERIKEAEASIEKMESAVKNILRNQYKNRDDDYINLLLKSDSFSEFIKRYKFAKVLSRKNIERVKEYRRLVERHRQDMESLELYKRELEDLKKKKEEEWKRYKNEKWKKYVLLKSIKNNIKKRSKMVKELNRSASRLKKLLEQLEVTAELSDKNAAQAFKKYKRKFPWPVEGGKVIARFGKHKHPKFKTIIYNNGIHISAKYGSPVCSIFGGTVKYADWFEGFGKMVIVSHGGGYFSIYTHLSRISVINGQSVKLKQEIGKIGDTESFYGTELYFEIRYKSKPLNPSLYLRKQ